jgi:FAD-dependent oxidoreductase domain-containing protein 1
MHPDIVIIGGGVVGSSIGLHLRRDGFTGRILVIERDPTYLKSSSYLAMGGIRQQFGSRENIGMVQYSLGFYAELEQMIRVLGVESLAFRQRGYLFLVDEARAETFRRRIARQRALGAVVEELSPESIEQLAPGVRVDDIAFGVLGPIDGYANARRVLAAMRQAALHSKVEFLTAEVSAIRSTAGSVTGVTLTSGDLVDTGVIVNAAGAYAGRVGRLAGLTLEIEPQRQHLFRARLPHAWSKPFPMVIDPGGVHWRHDDLEGPESLPDGIVCAKTKLDEPPGENFSYDQSRWTNDFLPDLVRRVPAFSGLRLANGWPGLYEMTPDHNPLLGAHPELTGFFVAAGFSGHGLMMCPATGKVMSEIIRTGRSETVDVSRFAVDRFARGAMAWDEAMI